MICNLLNNTAEFAKINFNFSMLRLNSEHFSIHKNCICIITYHFIGTQAFGWLFY